jgi:uncharacterized protein YjdB
MAIQNVIDALNIIRANASQEYQNRVPQLTRDNITAVGAPILEYTATMNEFATGLVNRIGLVAVNEMRLTNPLQMLKTGTLPFGKDVQEIFTNVAKGETFDPTGAGLLTRKIPDIKALYHRINRKDQYTVTITKEDLAKAFTSLTDMEALINTVINSMYSGDNLDEFILMKNLIATAVTGSKVKIIKVSHVSGADSAKAFIKAVRSVSALMQFPSSDFNTYFENKPATDTGNPVVTWCPRENQVLLIRSDVMTEVGVEALAYMFNMSVADFNAKHIEVDSFGSAVNCYALLADKAWFKIYDGVIATDDFYNPKGRYTNFFLTHEQAYSFSYFANAVAFVCDDEAISLNNNTLSLANKTPVALTATTTPAEAAVTWFSTNPKVATVSSTGSVTAVANGTANIIAVNGDKVAICVVTVALT